MTHLTFHEPVAPILLVDDNEDDAFTLRRAFRKLGLVNPLHFAADGQQAVEYLAALTGPEARAGARPLVVFLDLKMPYKDGFQVLEWIRQHTALSDLPVVMLTGSDEQRDIQRAYALGARSYMVKPATGGDIRRIFESLESHWQKIGARPVLGATASPANA